jgi:hypothetical protein
MWMHGQEFTQLNSGVLVLRPDMASFNAILETKRSVSSSDLNTTCEGKSDLRGDQRLLAYHLGIRESSPFIKLPFCFNDLRGKGGSSSVTTAKSIDALDGKVCVYHADVLRNSDILMLDDHAWIQMLDRKRYNPGELSLVCEWRR